MHISMMNLDVCACVLGPLKAGLSRPSLRKAGRVNVVAVFRSPIGNEMSAILH